ncbi:peptidase [Methylobacterium terricola]|uniref:Peptidase n=1 Tax=Methylobacterium terricola TaxID=2583531 RepID=A0A5C4LCT5_9HYPH|nr:prepilin peptidase [Methylobacterium terricola]TNC09275.1 peptidase [Methylobacterium terricola]
MASLCLLVVFPFLMAYAASKDVLTMKIPNRVSVILVGAFVLLAWTAGLGWPELGSHAGACALVFAIGFALYCAGVTGAGDVKLAAATALWLGFDALPDYVVNFSVLGGALALAILYMRSYPLPGFALGLPFAVHLHDAKVGTPYGVALSASALVTCPSAPLWRMVLQG